MGIDANGYCTQCRTYRGVPQAPQQPTSGTPYSGGPYGGQQPYAGYPTSSGPQYSAPPSYNDPISAPPTAYGATYGGGSSSSGGGRNKFLMPVLALSGVLVVLVVAIVVVAALKGGGDDNKTNPQANNTTGGPAATGTGKATEKAAIDECLVGTWTTKTFTQQVPMDGVGNVPITLTKNGSTIKFAADGKVTETYKDTVLSGNPTISGSAVAITLTVNATVTANVSTTSGTIAYQNLQSTGTINTKAPSINYDETEPFQTDDNPAKYTCKGNDLTLSGSTFTSTATKTS
ncbi:hypothetical protein ABT369_45180 [Dactylosporangium sp. NPDC000244]|uniref:hypothetical protein n=1 Tax=Dactylosporangium sp. NPDC000244 TaxID=3154365 RepID=UPI003319A50B